MQSATSQNKIPQRRKFRIPQRRKSFRNVAFRYVAAPDSATSYSTVDAWPELHEARSTDNQALWSQLRAVTFGEYAWKIGVRPNNDCRWCVPSTPPPPKAPPKLSLPKVPVPKAGKTVANPHPCVHCAMSFSSKEKMRSLPHAG